MHAHGHTHTHTRRKWQTLRNKYTDTNNNGMMVLAWV